MSLVTEKSSILNTKNISATPIRLLVLQTFLKQTQAFSLKDLEDKLFYSDRSTIFRTLRLFVKKGILHEIINLDGIKSYALCDDCENNKHNHQHGHLKCKVCEGVFCIPMNMNSLFSSNQHIKIDDIQIFINGLCKDCN